MLNIFIDLNIELSNNWSYSDIKNNIEMMIEKSPNNIIEALIKNPLLKQKENNSYILKYDFLESYLNTLALFKFFYNGKINNDFIHLLSKVNKESNEFKDIILFFKKTRDINQTLKSIKSQAVEKFIKSEEKEKNKISKFIEKNISLISDSKKNSPEDFNETLREIYDIDLSNKNLKYVFVNDDIHPINFQDLVVENCSFKNYPKFLKSNFKNSSFYHSNFDNCHNDKFPNSNFLDAKIDRSTCDIGDLETSYNIFSKKSEENEIFTYDELHKFLSSFYRGGSFRDNNKVHIRFSKHILGLMTNNFDRLINEEIITVSAKKEVDIFYAISDNLKSSVRKFLNDGTKDRKIKKIYEFIK